VIQIANKVTFSTEGMDAGLDPISMENFGKAILKDPVASRALAQMQRSQTNVTLSFEEAPRGLAGITEKDFNDINITIYMNSPANLTTKGAVSTFIHESSHAIRASRNLPIGTQLDEYRAFRREELFNLGRRPTLVERQAIWNDVIREYADKPIGGDIPSFLRPGY